MPRNTKKNTDSKTKKYVGIAINKNITKYHKLIKSKYLYTVNANDQDQMHP